MHRASVLKASMADPVSLFVSPIVEKVIDATTSLISKEFKLLRGIKDEIQTLKSVLTGIQSVLSDAEDKQAGVKQLSDWLGKLQEAAYDAQDIMETFSTEASLLSQKKHPWAFGVSKATYKLDAAHKIQSLLARLEQIKKEKDLFHLDVNVAKDHNDRNTDHVIESDVIGREDDRDKIIHMLVSEEFDRDGDVSVIPIIGMGGLGKTTLAQLVYNDASVKAHFEFLMWVCVTDNFDYRRILKEMIQYHSEMRYDINSFYFFFLTSKTLYSFKLPMNRYDINSLSDSQLKSRLLEFLERQSFLLVLDDVWTESYQDWERLQSLLKHGGKGCRVLVTSRTTRVSNVMGTVPPYLLDYLPENQCLSLFKKIAFKDGNSTGRWNSDLENIGREIVRKCEYLPLAVKAMGGLLRGNNDVQKWQRIVKNDVWKAEQDSNITGKPTVLPALKLSYDHLPPFLKQCFSYCYIFPKSYVFHKMELVKFWKAASLIQSRGEENPDVIGRDNFDDLLTRSFFQLVKVDKGETYRMHDLIHDLAQSISSPHCFQVKDIKSCSLIDERSRHVSLLCKEAAQPVLEVIDKSKKLRTLVAPTEYLKEFGQVLDNLFRTSKYIRVLDLSSSTLLELPESVGKLKLLRYLDLSRTEIKSLPNSICSLYNLQTLKLLGCLWLSELPKDLGNLVNLQHLELDDMFWHKLYTLPSKMGSLTSLQNLHAFLISREKGHGIDELKNLTSLIGTLHILALENAINAEEAKLKDKEGLKKVVFEWSCNRDSGPQDEAADERILEDLQPHSNVEELQVMQYRGTRFPSWLGDGSLSNIVKITLNHCTKCKVLSLVQLPHLGELHIKGLLELEEWPEAEYHFLSRLTINNCPNLRVLPGLIMNLRVLKIKKCGSLQALPVSPFVMFLILIDNPVLQDWNNVPLLVSSILELKIKNCPRLTVLPEYFAPQKLEISGCPLVTTLPNSEFSQRLQHLALDACADGTLVREIPDTSSMYSLVISKISSLKSLPQWPHLPGLKALYIHQCEDVVSLAEEEEEEKSFQALNSLELLSIRGCPKLVTLQDKGLPRGLKCLSIGSCNSLKSLGPKEMLINLTSLKDLYIDNCPELDSLPEEGLPTSLQHLRIEGCPLMTEQCRKETGPYWPKIMHIPDLELDSPMKIEHTLTEASSARWYPRFTRSKG
ncbi:hypothetical protein ACHQM5_017092 [Ranunculus cassubicifolius]